jgi:peptide/nickel transport system permease protein
MRRIGRQLPRRLWQSVITIALIMVINFAVVHAAPGDAADVLAGEAGTADPGEMATLRAHLGLDRPLPVQFVIYMASLARLDLGLSLHSRDPVLRLLLDRLPATLLLMLPSLALAFVLGVALGGLAAMRVNSITDFVISLVALAAYAMPLFWLGLMLIVLFTLKLGWLPSGGIAEIGVAETPFQTGLDVLRHMVLPVITLSLFYVAGYAMLMRAAMLEVSRAAYVRTARAKGLAEWRVVWRHVFRNALLPVVTLLGLQIGAVLGGAVVVEVVFSWPGLGLLAFDAVFQRDTTVLLGLFFFCSLLVVAVNLVIDLLYAWLDPRVELGRLP